MKRSALLLLLIFSVSLVWGDVTESFDGLSESSYGNYSYNGFDIVNGLCNSTNALSGNAVRLRNAATSLTYSGLDGNGKDGGVGTISFWYRSWDDSPAAEYFVEVNVNLGGWTSVGSTINSTSTTYSQWSYSLNNSNDNILIRVNRTNGERLHIDDFNITDFGVTPTITLSETALNGFTYIEGNGPSAEQSFTVEGSNLTADISIDAPADYEISTSTGAFFVAEDPITLTQTGGSVAETTIYVRLKTGLAIGIYNNENITAISTDADAKTVVCNGDVTEVTTTTDVWNLDFETVGGYTTSVAEFTDSDADYFLRTDGTNISSSVEFLGIQGDFYFAAQDTDGDGQPSNLTLDINDVSISGYSNLIFSIDLAEDQATDDNEDWDTSSYMHISYDIDNSGSFTNLIWIEAAGSTNTEPKVDTNFDGTGDGTALSPTFATFSKDILSTGSLIDIKITFNDLDAGDEDIAIDNLKIVGDAPLPVTLTSFTAAQFQNDMATIMWETASESNMSHFKLYRDEMEITSVNASNTSETHRYSVHDEELEAGQTYSYYLEAVEYDGHSETFGPIILSINEDVDPEDPPSVDIAESTLMGNFPNPFNPTTIIKFNVDEEETGTLEIYSSKGQLIKTAEFGTGEHTYTWNANNQASGVYFYKLKTESYSETKKMVLLK